MTEGLREVARRQRAHRAFTEADLSDEQVLALLEVATRAPSAENTQPWRFVVVRDPALRAAIGDLTARAWSGGGKAWAARTLPADMLADVDAGATGGVAAAPVLVVVCADTTACVPSALPPSIWPAVQNLLLAATAAGLGSALTTLTTVFEAELTALLALPEGQVPVAVVPLGHPARELKPGRRRPVAEVTTWR